MTDGDGADAGSTDGTDTDAVSTGDGQGGSDSGNGRGGRGGRAGRDVVVPMRLYKTVTVFSTLIAVVCVVFGFMLLDAATLNVSFLSAIVRAMLAAAGLSADEGILRTVFAATGLGIIAFGAGVYVIGTRFRAPGMGKSQEDSGEGSNNNG